MSKNNKKDKNIENYLRNHTEDIFWISRFPPDDEKLSLEFIEEFSDYVDWEAISRYDNLTEDFIRKYQDKIDWEIISYNLLSEAFIREFQDKVKWFLVSIKENLSEEFIKEFFKKMSPFTIIQLQHLSEEFIRKNYNWYFWWKYIFQYQKVSELYIREYMNHINRRSFSIDKEFWDIISEHQKLSEDFIREFSNILNWENIIKHQDLSKEFILENLRNGVIDYIDEETKKEIYEFINLKEKE